VVDVVNAWWPSLAWHLCMEARRVKPISASMERLELCHQTLIALTWSDFHPACCVASRESSRFGLHARLSLYRRSGIDPEHTDVSHHHYHLFPDITTDIKATIDITSPPHPPVASPLVTLSTCPFHVTYSLPLCSPRRPHGRDVIHKTEVGYITKRRPNRGHKQYADNLVT